ncbi:unnamed protein product [Thelazia callipaeda]|uniref:Uncharacterized protein n=1 Tax=Thelazia callipaeda TaxID=103827 RepID=A0A0N5CX90_THECL|nr:unnamed protein product [Thelazia callipaeda]
MNKNSEFRMAVVGAKQNDRIQATQPMDSVLGLNQNHVFLITNMRRDVNISWNFSSSINDIDWIGLFRVG